MRRAAAILWVALAGCYKPSIASGDLFCDPSGACPSGFHCAADKSCWKDGEALRAPDAPAQIQAVAGIRSAQVTWLPPLHSGGSAVTKYTVTASPGGATAVSNGADGTFVVVPGLLDGATYTFTVVAENNEGKSGPSPATAPLTTPSPPSAPLNVTAVAGNGQALVSWTAPASGGLPITAYTVTSSPAQATSTQAGTTATLFLLHNGTPYTFTVVATNEVGTGPASAPSAAVTPATVPGAPTILTATAGVRTATFQFAPPDDGGRPITTYRVLQSLGGAAFTASAATVSGSSASVTGLQNGGSYRFELGATNSLGDGPLSPASSAVQLPDVPGKVTGVTATASSGAATVSWTAPAANGASILGYTATASPSGQTVTSTSTVASFTGLAAGTPVTFRVLATNAAGDGPLSDPSGAVTPVRPRLRGDFDGDGREDLALGTESGVRVELARGEAYFVELGKAPSQLALSDGALLALAEGELFALRGKDVISKAPACGEPCALALSGSSIALAAESLLLLRNDAGKLVQVRERGLAAHAAQVEFLDGELLVRGAGGLVLLHEALDAR